MSIERCDVQWTEWSHAWFGYSGRQRPHVSLGSSTVVRVKEDDEPDPEFKPRPVGFTADIEPVEKEPRVWEGDGA